MRETICEGKGDYILRRYSTIISINEFTITQLWCGQHHVLYQIDILLLGPTCFETWKIDPGFIARSILRDCTTVEAISSLRANLLQTTSRHHVRHLFLRLIKRPLLQIQFVVICVMKCLNMTWNYQIKEQIIIASFPKSFSLFIYPHSFIQIPNPLVLLISLRWIINVLQIAINICF